jgi:hypothetical protein
MAGSGDRKIADSRKIKDGNRLAGYFISIILDCYLLFFHEMGSIIIRYYI